jgi:hypothetical protein
MGGANVRGGFYTPSTQCYECSCTWYMNLAEEPAAISITLTVILHLNLNRLYRIVFLFTEMEISNIRATALHPAPNVLYITAVQYY